MAGVDASIYGQLQQPSNPLAMAQGIYDLKARALANQQAQMGIDAQNQAAAAAQAGILPGGGYDPAASIAAAGQSGNALGAPAAIAEALAAQGKQVDINTLLQAYAAAGRNQAGSVLGSLMAKNNYNGVDWSRGIQSGIAAGYIPAIVGKQALQDIADTGGDPDKLKSVGQGYLISSMGNGAYTPSVPGYQPGETNPSLISPAGIIAGPTGGGAGAGTAATGGASAGTPPAGGPPRYVFSVPSGLAPQAGQAFDRINAAVAGGDQSGKRLAQLQTLDEMNERFTSGPAAEDITQMAKLFNELTGSKFNVEANNAVDVFEKTAIQFAASQGYNLPPTDLGALERLKSNPNTTMAHDAIHQIVGKLMGIEEMNLAAQRYAQSYQGLPSDQQANAATDWAQHENPFVFQLAHMPPAEQAAQFEAMKKNAIGGGKTQFNKFSADWMWFHQHGLLPGQQQGAPNAQ